MLCTPSNWRPFLYHTKMTDFEYFLVLSVSCKEVGTNSESSDIQINEPQHGHPKRADLPDINIKTGVQSINTARASLKLVNSTLDYIETSLYLALQYYDICICIKLYNNYCIYTTDEHQRHFVSYYCILYN